MAKAPEPTASIVDETKDTESPKLQKAQPNGEMVEVVITKFGEGKVSTGEHVAGEGDIYASRGDKIIVAKHVAVRLEVLGVAEAD
jgi:hypothetical protein